MRFKIIYLLFLLILNSSIFGQFGKINSDYAERNNHEECTIGVASGSATIDGRPLLWKSRDYTSDQNNVVKYITSLPINFISVFTSDSSNNARMGVNEHGFAIVNSYATDLHLGSLGPNNGELMKEVLGNCTTVHEFQNYLDSTNLAGRRTRSNFAVIDSTGVAAIFEVADTVYWRFDAADSPKGYIIRTNFTINGGSTGGIERYNRSTELISNFYNGDSLSYKNIIRYQMRDFADSVNNPVPLPFSDYWQADSPYGYINTDKSICRYSTVSAVVIQGVLSDEQAVLSTMWTILGQPAASVAVPYWPVGETPVETSGTPRSALCDKAIEIRSQLFNDDANKRNIDSYKLLNGVGGGLWTCTFPIEDFIFTDIEYYLNNLRMSANLSFESMLNKEDEIAEYVLSELSNCYNAQIADTADIALNKIIKVYPNPFIDKTNIEYYLSEEADVLIEILSFTGQKIETLYNNHQAKGRCTRLLNTAELDYSDGIYFIRILINNEMDTYKIVKISN